MRAKTKVAASIASPHDERRADGALLAVPEDRPERRRGRWRSESTNATTRWPPPSLGRGSVTRFVKISHIRPVIRTSGGVRRRAERGSAAGLARAFLAVHIGPDVVSVRLERPDRCRLVSARRTPFSEVLRDRDPRAPARPVEGPPARRSARPRAGRHRPPTRPPASAVERRAAGGPRPPAGSGAGDVAATPAKAPGAAAAAAAEAASGPRSSPPSRRKKIPWWAVPAVVGLPVWAVLYAVTLEPPTRAVAALDRAAQERLPRRTAAPAATAPTGGGGVGPGFAGGDGRRDLPDFEDHVEWVTLGSGGEAESARRATATRPEPAGSATSRLQRA